ncbi:MAG: nucleotide exchange factor GrpE, partial [Oligoflexia bacterium]|nr:nucleotide exchange factor GrpE [Oligoflexia bacterium]
EQAEAKAASDTAALQKRVEELEAQVKEKESKYLYLYAEFENFKKRSIKERSDLLKFGWEGLARELLQVIDNLERALAHMPPNSDRSLIDGLHMVLNQFRATLSQGGVQTIDSVGKPFDPHHHEAMAQEASELPEGNVTQEHSKGYTLHGRLLRPARVVVSSGSPPKK